MMPFDNDRDYLLGRYQAGTINYDEAQRLQGIMTQEAARLQARNDAEAAAAVLMFLLALAAFIALMARR